MQPDHIQLYFPQWTARPDANYNPSAQIHKNTSYASLIISNTPALALPVIVKP